MSTLLTPKKFMPIVTLPSDKEQEKSKKTPIELGLLKNEDAKLANEEVDVDTDDLEDDFSNIEDEEEIEDDTPIFSDSFIVETKFFDQNCIKNIALPKFIMSQGSMSFREKGYVMITFWGNHKSNTYKQVLQSIRDGVGKFKIKFIDPDTKEQLSVWEFLNPTVHAIDFGHVARMRTSPAEFAVEFDYSGLVIDDVTL